MRTLFVCLALLGIGGLVVQAQGTFVYDQESSPDEMSPYGGVRIQFYSSLGQSFTPSLSTVGFIRLKLYDINPNNGVGATLLVNLRSSSISGTILGTAQVALADSFGGSVDFIFGNAISVTPSATYFFDTVVQTGDSWGATIRGDYNYPNGSVYADGFPFPASDFWFREGIVVPEPSVVCLLLGGGMLACCRCRKQRGSVTRRGIKT